jgi:GT2 family glycosyltransferase
MDRASIHVVIVNWNSGAQLQECLQSFAAVSSDDVALTRVSVIDNASTDGSCDGLAAPDLPLAIIRNDSNRGFAAACNQGAAGSTADFLLLLNPDTRLQQGCLELPARYLGATHHETVGIVGIQLVDADGHVARNTARTPTAWSTVGNVLGLDRLLPTLFPPHFMTEWAHDETRDVDQVMGAFFFVRRAVFEMLGGFDERFFVYYEDMDFAVRAREQSWSSVYLASAQAYHRGQGTTEGATAQRTFYFCRSRVLYARKHFGAFGAFAVMFATFLLEPVVRVLAALVTRRGSVVDVLRAYKMLWADLPNILREQR